MRNMTKYVIAGAVVLAALGYFIYTGLNSDKLYYKEIQAVLDNPEEMSQRGLRISGNVLHDNFEMNKFQKSARFDMTDETGGVLQVVYTGTIPDAFEQGADVVIEGKYDPSARVFHANKLMAKCPSKYEAQGEEHPDEVVKGANS